MVRTWEKRLGKLVLSILEKRKQRGNLTATCNYLRRKCRDGDRLFLDVHSERTRGNEHKLELPLRCQETFLYQEGGKIFEWAAQRGSFRRNRSILRSELLRNNTQHTALGLLIFVGLVRILFLPPSSDLRIFSGALNLYFSVNKILV